MDAMQNYKLFIYPRWSDKVQTGLGLMDAMQNFELFINPWCSDTVQNWIRLNGYYLNTNIILIVSCFGSMDNNYTNG